MSTNSNFKKDKCWSCEYFCGKREYKKGWLGDFVETADWGVCANQKNYLNRNQKVQSDYGWCNYYQKWSVLQSAIAMQEQKKAQERAEREQKQAFERQERENQRQQELLRAERHRLEEERKRLEYERWYNSLSPEEKRREDERKEQERLKEEELRKQQEEEDRKQQEENRILEKKKKQKRLCIAVGSLILFALLLSLAFTGFVIYSSKMFIVPLSDASTVMDQTLVTETINELNERISKATVSMIFEFIGIVATVLMIIFINKKIDKK